MCPEFIDDIDIAAISTMTGTVQVILPEDYGKENYRYVNRHGYKSNANNKTFMKNTPQCKIILKINDNPAKLNINLAETDDMIIAIISEINVVTNMRNWVIDSGATRHICINKNDFVSYTQVEKGEDIVYLGD
uniref:Gag-pol polyprotein n=1 Tax=Solanum tuberosum TaxID=4113 RepID=M1CMY3_SOLTU